MKWWINFIRQLDDRKVIFDRSAEILLAIGEWATVNFHPWREYWQVCPYPIYFFTSPSGIQPIISANPKVEITSPGLVDFLTPEIIKFVCFYIFLPEFLISLECKLLKCHNDVQHSNVNFMIYVTLAHIKYNWNLVNGLTFACVRHCGGCIWTTSICCRIRWCWLLCCNRCRVDIGSSTWSLSRGLYFRLCNNSRCSIVCCIRGVDWFRCSWYIN